MTEADDSRQDFIFDSGDIEFDHVRRNPENHFFFKSIVEEFIMALDAAQETTTVIFLFGRPNDRYGEFGSAAGCFWTTALNVGSLSMAGTASLEIDATLLTIRPLDECRVWSKHFGETKVSSRCIPEFHISPLLAFIIKCQQ